MSRLRVAIFRIKMAAGWCETRWIGSCLSLDNRFDWMAFLYLSRNISHYLTIYWHWSLHRFANFQVTTWWKCCRIGAGCIMAPAMGAHPAADLSAVPSPKQSNQNPEKPNEWMIQINSDSLDNSIIFPATIWMEIRDRSRENGGNPAPRSQHPPKINQ